MNPLLSFVKAKEEKSLLLELITSFIVKTIGRFNKNETRIYAIETHCLV